MSFAIETQGLRFRAGRSFQLRGLDMHVPAGSVYGFLGPNGAGKTTTIRLLLGLLKPAGGAITILGESMPSHYTRVLARTGYVPERPHVYPTLTVGEAVDLHRAFHPSWDDTWCSELLDKFALDRDRVVGSLSKGESGKLLILLALSQKPDLLVLDEPTDGLDPLVRRDILAAVLDYVTERRATVLISSHLVHELERICDWISLLDRGELVAELPMQEFKNGLKRLRVNAGPLELQGAPFTVLSRERATNNTEHWLVRGWEPAMTQYLEAGGASVREVIDLDLEDGFVELLRSSRDRLRKEG